ncbi:ATP synthase subunit C lysine N-methyltransferase [Leguminivora glycinivorella]|uniref:ATP synthase subunit C lysine N-methyltransferase n=1 Tax=Leguminivora glycinivorella TaxID=1035111 RepID=UPI00200EE5EE|nr:ATP synthase subunit C lysine N-methyltransferase [Leguminivora glycinivorella]
MELELLGAETNAPKKLSRAGKILIYTTGGLAVGVSIVCIPFVSPALRKVCLPYVPATTEQLAGVTKALSGRSGRLLDVGSGDGRIVFTAAKLGFKSDGVELNPWLVYYSRIAALLSSQSQNTKFYRRNLWTFSLKPYNNIVIFGVEQMMAEFENKLLDETENGTVVVACRFPLPNMKPVETIGHGVDTVWKYEIKR